LVEKCKPVVDWIDEKEGVANDEEEV